MVESGYSLQDLFDLDEVQKLQDAFSRATGVASIITESDGTPITKPSGSSFLCYEIIRKTKERIKNRALPDTGLMNGRASIMLGSRHIADWLIGQVIDSKTDTGELLGYAEAVGEDREIYGKSTKKTPGMSVQQFSNVVNLLSLNADQLSALAGTNSEQKAEILKRAVVEKQLADEKELFKVTVQSLGDAVITTDIFGRITALNKAAERLTGWTQDEAQGIPLENVFRTIQEKKQKKFQNPVSKALRIRKPLIFVNHSALISKDFTVRSIAESRAPVIDADGYTQGAILIFRDITEEKKKGEEIHYLNYHDKLTGLYNRAFFEKELQRLDSGKELPVTILVGDVNGHKITNDIFGHTEGDRLLKAIGDILRKSCREGDIIARWGGDEFAVILPNTDYKTALEICNRIKANCKDYKTATMQPNIALGLDTKEEAAQSLLTVIKKAEDRMYRNKLFESKSKQGGTVASLQRALLEKSYETEEHALRLINLSQKIGDALGLHENEMNDLKLLASLHDIGKVAISDTILLKPGKLTKDEWEEMKRHSEIGFRIAQSAPELSHISEYILCHHERWDGAGYPQGRSGDAIPLLSRIISIADSYDVMTHIRSYKDKISKEEALAEIRLRAGTQFDPVLADLFIRLMSS